MYTSGITSEYSILDCPQMMPMVIERPNNWKFNKGAEVVAPNCPRCASSNTKFCYYNNYSFSQPRYFCKACRRYWTKGGSLRNVPVGGGCRKSRRSRARQAAAKNGPAPAVSPDAGSTNTSETSSADIDLAAVFAKYVNPNADTNESSSPGASSESYENVPASCSDMDSQVGDVGLMFEYQSQVDWISGVEDQVLPQMCMNEDVSCGREFVYQNGDHAFEMQQGVLGDDPAAEMWSDVTNLQSFGSQLQEFDLFAPEDQLRIPAGNLTNDTGAHLISLPMKCFDGLGNNLAGFFF